MREKTYTWNKIADSIGEIAFSSNGIAEVQISGKTLCVILQNNTLFGCTSKCPHAGGSLLNGYIDGKGNIICPLHRYKFNLQTGRNVSGEGYYLKVFPIETREEGVFVGFEENNLSWLV